MKKNLAKLTKKKITDKNGVSRYVWVKTSGEPRKKLEDKLVDKKEKKINKFLLSKEIFEAFEFLGIKKEKFEDMKKEHGGTLESLHKWLGEELAGGNKKDSKAKKIKIIKDGGTLKGNFNDLKEMHKKILEDFSGGKKITLTKDVVTGTKVGDRVSDSELIRELTFYYESKNEDEDIEDAPINYQLLKDKKGKMFIVSDNFSGDVEFVDGLHEISDK